MDKIYSRKRLKIPKILFEDFSNKKENTRKTKIFKIAIILIIAICVMVRCIKGLNPILNKLCIDVSRKEATIISNQKATEVMANYEYEDLVKIYKDENGNITMLEANIIAINEITSDIAIKIQEAFSENEQSKVYINIRKHYRN